MDEAAYGQGLRDWLEQLPRRAAPAAAFDTRIDAPALLTGHASSGIAKRLRRHGYRLVVPGESFLVDKQSHLLEGELARARAWGTALARSTVVAASAS